LLGRAAVIGHINEEESISSEDEMRYSVNNNCQRHHHNEESNCDDKCYNSNNNNNNHNHVKDKDIQKASSFSDEQWTVITALFGICLVIGMTLGFILMESKIFNL
jgi:hypothetical protein